MTPQTYAISAYKAAIRTAPPLKGVVMLYDAALVRIASAEAAASDRDSARHFAEISKAVKILTGLNDCLDMEIGGQVARSLRDLYQSVIKALYSSVGSPVAPLALNRTAAALRLTRDAWAEIAGMPVSGAPSTAMQ